MILSRGENNATVEALAGGFCFLNRELRLAVQSLKSQIGANALPGASPRQAASVARLSISRDSTLEDDDPKELTVGDEQEESLPVRMTNCIASGFNQAPSEQSLWQTSQILPQPSYQVYPPSPWQPPPLPTSITMPTFTPSGLPTPLQPPGHSPSLLPSIQILPESSQAKTRK